MATTRFGARTTGQLDNFAATTAPGVSDDGVAGYGIGSIWVNVTSDLAYVCVDISTGAAVWDLMAAVAITPSAQVWTGITNATEDRALDCNATTIDELADAFATFVSDVRATGLFTT